MKNYLYNLLKPAFTGCLMLLLIQGSVISVLAQALVSGKVTHYAQGEIRSGETQSGETQSGEIGSRHSGSAKGKALDVLISELQDQYQVSFLYEKETLAEKTVKDEVDDEQDLEVMLDKILNPHHLTYEKISKGTYVILQQKDSAGASMSESKQLFRQAAILEKTIRGKVTDAESGDELPGVNVLAKGTTTGTVTDIEGNYSLTVADDINVLVFSSVGYVSQEVPINGQNTINVQLTSDIQSLSEVVVIGYGTQERSEVTGAVSSVSAEEISRQPVSGLDEALQGRAAGVQVTPSTGQPGAPININIRGIGSFGNTSPLYVIDGVPVFNEVRSMGNAQSNPLATLNPGNIASIEILKDASAAAIYGARAANGVVLITTKRGEAGATKFSLRGYYGVQQFNRAIDMMNSQQFAAYSIAADQAAGREPVPAFSDPEVLAQNTDWQDEAFNAAPIQDYSLTVSGGNENARFAVIGGYFDQEGLLVNNAFKRYSLRINSDFNVGERLKIGESISISRGYWRGGFNPASDILQELLQSSPTLPVRNPDNLGGFAGPTFEVSGRVNRSNQIASLSLIQNDLYQNRVLGNIYAEYALIPGLTYRLNLGGDIMYGESKVFTPVYEAGNRSNPRASLSESRRSDNTYLIENTLTYDKTFNEDHSITVLAGYTQQSSLVKDISGSIQDFPSNDLRTINAGFGQSNLSGGESEWALRSFLGRINYGFKDKYLFMATVRRDGSSRFGENTRYGTFPSFSAGWRISEEPFMNNVNLLSDVKLRASWGQVGNQEIDNYAAIATIDPVARYIFGTGQGLVAGATYLSLGNPDLRWETSTQTDIGLDLGFLEDRLTFIIDYYVKNTSDVLLRLPVVTTSGIRRSNGAYQNAAEIRNSGLELAATYRNSSGGFQYNISGNFSTINNEVISFGGGEPIIAQLSSDPNFATTYTEEGGEIGAFYGHVMDGIFRDQGEVDAHAEQPGAAPGDIRFQDLNDDGVINGDDRKIIGSPIPDFFYGLNADFSYKGFDVALFFQGVEGAEVYNLLWAGINDGEGDNNATTAMLDRWTENNRDTNVPRAVAGDPNDNDRPSTRFVEDGSYLRLRNLQIGYNFSAGIAERLNLSNLRIYTTAQNLFTITPYRSYNPDVGTLSTDSRSTLTKGIDFGAYPIPRVFTLGVQVDF